MKLAFAIRPGPGAVSAQRHTRSLAARCRFVALGALLLGGFLYLCLCLFFVLHQRQFQYTLGGTRSTPEAATAAGFTEVKGPTEDGERLDGLWRPPPGRGRVGLFLPCTASTGPHHGLPLLQLEH